FGLPVLVSTPMRSSSDGFVKLSHRITLYATMSTKIATAQRPFHGPPNRCYQHRAGRLPTDQGFDEWFGIKNSSDEAGYSSYKLFRELGYPEPQWWEGVKGQPVTTFQAPSIDRLYGHLAEAFIELCGNKIYNPKLSRVTARRFGALSGVGEPGRH